VKGHPRRRRAVSGGEKSLNGREKIRAKKVKNERKSRESVTDSITLTHSEIEFIYKRMHAKQNNDHCDDN